MNIWIFIHYAKTPETPGGTRHIDFASELVKRGHQVTIWASSFHSSLFKEMKEYTNDKFVIEDYKGVGWVWLKTYPYRANNWKRFANMFSYCINGHFAHRKIKKRKLLEAPDIVVGATVHPLAAFSASALARKLKRPFIFEIGDLWPQTFIDMGIWKEKSMLSRFFKSIEKRTVKRADGIIVFSPLAVKYLSRQYGYPEDKISLIPNGVRTESFNQGKSESDYFKAPEECFKLVYLGSIEQVHGLDTLLEAMALLKDHKSIKLFMVGAGKKREPYMAMCKARGIDNVQWVGAVPKAEVLSVLKQADALYLSTGKVLYGSENKLYDYLLAGKPIVAGVYGDHNDFVEQLNVGLSVSQDSPEKITDAILKIQAIDKAKREQMGEHGKQYLFENNRIEVLADRMESRLKNTIAEKS
ncbi:MAG: glycosyltransferase family 4 protein [bacterium]|nr:glycosyltransferase family 4 protein [bacterium]